MFHVINRNTGAVVGKSKTSIGARRIRERKDLAYGAYIHIVKPA